MSDQVQIQQTDTSSSCFYAVAEFPEGCYVVCLACDRVHGLLDSRTRRPVAFSRRADARRVSRALNSGVVVAC